jgi:predicted amidophosphoribosyltransferase
VGAGIGVFLIFMIWLIVFLLLSVIWFMSRSRGRTCPRCGENVRKGQTRCRKCGYDYAANLPAGGSAPG